MFAQKQMLGEIHNDRIQDITEKYIFQLAKHFTNHPGTPLYLRDRSDLLSPEP